MACDDHAAGDRLPLLHPLHRRRRGRGPRDADVLRLGLLQQRHRGAGAGRRLLRHERRAARAGAPALVPLEGHGNLAARLHLHAARLRHQQQSEISGAVSAAWVGRERARVARSGSRRRDHGQPDRGEESQTHDHRHGQPERGEARRERSVVLRSWVDDASGPRTSSDARRRAGRTRGRPWPRRARLAGQFGLHRDDAR